MSRHAYEQYLDAFGDELRRAGEPEPRRPRRRWLALAPAGAVACVVAVLAVGGGGSGGDLDPVAAAEAALTPRGDIIHMRMVVNHGPGRATHTFDRAPIVTEQWSATGPDRSRVLVNAPGITGRVRLQDGAGRTIRSERVTKSEYTVTGDRAPMTAHYEGGKTIGRLTMFDRYVPRPTYFEDVLPGRDPIAGLRQKLASGELRDAGEARSGGETVRRLVSTGDAAQTYDVDSETFAPLAITLGSGRDASKYTVTRYERLPKTAANLRLLRIEQAQETQVFKVRCDVPKYQECPPGVRVR